MVGNFITHRICDFCDPRRPSGAQCVFSPVEQYMHTLIAGVFIAAAYIALAALSSALAYAPTDAWTVWLASGVTVGLLLAAARASWPLILGAAALGAAIFSLTLDGKIGNALGYAAIEAVSAAAGAWIGVRVANGDVRFESPRELGAFVLAVLVQSLICAALAGAGDVASGGKAGMRTFNVCLLANLVGSILVAPLFVTWAGFRPKRSGGLPMPQFVAGAV